MTTKVAPKTLQEVIRMSPEELQTLNVEELQAAHEIASGGTTKAAKLKKDMIEWMIAAKQKEAAKASKSETVVNSAKTAGKKANAAKASATKATASNKPSAKAAKPTPPTPPAPPKAASKGTTTKASKTTPKRTTAKAETPQDGFPEVIESENYNYRRFVPEDIQQLGEVLVANPYAVYVFMDERVDDTLTQCLLTYASDKLALFVDKSRQPETFLSVTTAAGVEQFIAGEYVQKDGKQSVSFPVAFYLREARG